MKAQVLVSNIFVSKRHFCGYIILLRVGCLAGSLIEVVMRETQGVTATCYHIHSLTGAVLYPSMRNLECVV